MSKNTIIIITDDQMVAMRARQFGESLGAKVKCYSPKEYKDKEANLNKAVEALRQIESEVHPNRRKEFDAFIESDDPESAISGSLFVHAIAGKCLKEMK